MKRLIATALSTRREELKTQWKKSHDLTEQNNLIERIAALVREEKSVRIEIAAETNMQPLLNEVKRLRMEGEKLI